MRDCIPFYEPGHRITGRAEGTIEGKRFVVQQAAWVPGGGNNIDFQRAGAGVAADGVNVWDVTDEATMSVISAGGGGIVPVTSGAAITFGQEVEVDASGRAIPLATGEAVGKAYSTVGAADLDVAVRLY